MDFTNRLGNHLRKDLIASEVLLPEGHPLKQPIEALRDGLPELGAEWTDAQRANATAQLKKIGTYFKAHPAPFGDAVAIAFMDLKGAFVSSGIDFEATLNALAETPAGGYAAGNPKRDPLSPPKGREIE